MQNIFAPGGIWATPWMERVLPAIVAVAELNPQLHRVHPICDASARTGQAGPMAAILYEMGMCDTLSSAWRAA